MHHLKRLSASVSALALAAVVVSANTASAEVAGSTNLVCASVDVVACTEGTCMEGRAQTFDLPTFMFMDFDRKVVYAREADGDELFSPIKSSEMLEDVIILQGFENQNGWTAAIDRKQGGLSLSITGAEVSFTIFGNCTGI